MHSYRYKVKPSYLQNIENESIEERAVEEEDGTSKFSNATMNMPERKDSIENKAEETKEVMS